MSHEQLERCNYPRAHHPHAFVLIPYYNLGEPVMVSCDGLTPEERQNAKA